MQIATDAIKADGQLWEQYTCDGDNMSPPLTFSEIPKNAQSLVLIMEDPDAPSGLFTHWLLYDMSPATLQIPENEMPLTGMAGTNDFGNLGYGGPCPPKGRHHYIFRLYAMDSTLDIPEGANRDALLDAMDDHVIIDMAEITATYEKH